MKAFPVQNHWTVNRLNLFSKDKPKTIFEKSVSKTQWKDLIITSGFFCCDSPAEFIFNRPTDAKRCLAGLPINDPDDLPF